MVRNILRSSPWFLVLCILAQCASAQTLTLKEFTSQLEGARVVEIGKVVLANDNWRIVEQTTLSDAESQEFNSLITKASSYEDTVHRCPYMPNYAAIVENNGTRFNLLYCFGCHDFQAKGVVETEIRSFEPIAGRLKDLFEKSFEARQYPWEKVIMDPKAGGGLKGDPWTFWYCDKTGAVLEVIPAKHSWFFIRKPKDPSQCQFRQISREEAEKYRNKEING